MKKTHAAPHAKLTPAQVLEIRRLGKTEPQRWIAQAYKITDGLVSQIINRHAWRWLRAITLLIVVAGAARADLPAGYKTLQEFYGSCDVAVAFFLNPGTQPRNDCQYPLNNVVVFQKVKDGFLLSGDFETGGTEGGVIFLKTKAPLTKGMRFDNEPVKPIGTYKYEGIDGFEKTAWAFDVVPPAAAQ